MEHNIELSPNFVQNVMDKIKADKFVFTERKEVKQLWHFSLVTIASAAVVTLVLAISLGNTNPSADQMMNLTFNDFDVTLMSLTD